LVDRESFNVSTSASTSTDVANQWNEFYKKRPIINAYLAAKSKWDSDYAKWLADPIPIPIQVLHRLQSLLLRYRDRIYMAKQKLY
jgi:hypothetical protein